MPRSCPGGSWAQVELTDALIFWSTDSESNSYIIRHFILPLKLPYVAFTSRNWGKSIIKMKNENYMKSITKEAVS